MPVCTATALQDSTEAKPTPRKQPALCPSQSPGDHAARPLREGVLLCVGRCWRLRQPFAFWHAKCPEMNRKSSCMRPDASFEQLLAHYAPALPCFAV